MSSSIKTTFFLSLIALLSFYLWENTVFIKIEDQQTWLLYLHFGILLISFISIRWTFLPTKFQPYLRGLMVVSFFFIIFILWNILFRWYSDTFDFKGNIFRGILYGFRAPFYGRLKPAVVITKYYPAIATSVLFIILVVTINWKSKSKWITPLLVLLGAILFFTFAWDTSFHKTLMATNCHYKTFSEGLSAFPDWASFLSSYTDQMRFLGAHNNHYPPGVLILLKLNNELYPYLIKLLVIIAPILSIFPLIGILKHFSISTQSINLYIAFYISSFALLFFPGRALTPLHLPLATSFLYLLIKSFDKKQIKYGVLAGVVLSVYAFLSFSFLVFTLFCFVFIALLLVYKKIELQQLVLPSLAILTTFIVIYTAVDLLFDFNLYTCFNEAFRNEGAQMKSSGVDNLTRYFIVSTGNLIAYIGVFGSVIIGLFGERIYAKAINKKSSFMILIRAVLATIIILSFSSQFYLEIERIWIFLSPFVLFGVLLYGPVSKMKSLSPLRIALVLNVIISVVYIIMINKCT